MSVSPAVPGIFFCSSAMILLIFVSVSVPVWEDISFLDTRINGKVVKYGVWGYTGSKATLGYSLQPPGFDDTFLNNATLKNLTYILILHPIGAGLSFLSVAFGAWGVISYDRLGTILMTMASSLAFLVTTIAFSIDMILWNIVQARIKNDGDTATLGNANWLTLGALVALILGSCAAGCGSFGRYRNSRYHYHLRRSATSY